MREARQSIRRRKACDGSPKSTDPGWPGGPFYKIGERMFGAVPTPERIMAHRMPLMLGIGGLWGSIEWFATLDKALRALLQLHVAKLYGSVY